MRGCGLLHTTALCQKSSGYFTWPSLWCEQLCSGANAMRKETFTSEAERHLSLWWSSLFCVWSGRLPVVRNWYILIWRAEPMEWKTQTGGEEWKRSHSVFVLCRVIGVMLTFSSTFLFDLPWIWSCTQTRIWFVSTLYPRPVSHN